MSVASELSPVHAFQAVHNRNDFERQDSKSRPHRESSLADFLAVSTIFLV
jgi:hypothetical protein